MTAETHGRGTLRNWLRSYETVRERMEELTERLSAEQLRFKPDPKRWSVAECLDHLTVSMRVYNDPMEPIVEEARASTAKETGEDGGEASEDEAGAESAEPYGRGTFVGRFLVRALSASGKRYPAPRAFKPRQDALDPATVRRGFEEELDRLEAAARRSEGLPLGELRMPWPVFRPVKLSLAQAFEIQALHLERHLDQAERLTREEGFPGAEELA